jgi:NADH:quinone reductase (non-electrogenic)
VRTSKADRPAPVSDAALPHVIITGGGFAGLTCAQGLRHARARVTIIDERNFHLFQPLPYQVATAALSPADIAMPIRHVLQRQRNAKVVLGRVEAIDRAARTVRLARGEPPLRYDYLVVATSARHAYFGNDAWEAFARPEDDRRRARDPPPRPGRVREGGSHRGSRGAPAPADLHRGRRRPDRGGEFHAFDAGGAPIVLVEAGPRILPQFPPRLSEKARRLLHRLCVEVLTNTMVERCDADGIVAAGRRLEARTLIRAAGVAASRAAAWLNVEADRAGRVRVAPDLSLPDDPVIFVIGDTALLDHSRACDGA